MTEIIASNIELANYSKPTPVQVNPLSYQFAHINYSGEGLENFIKFVLGSSSEE